MNNKILIVEDDPKISRFVSLELTHEGYETEIKADGREALADALEHDYGLIVLDVMLPSLNGIEVLRRLRQVHACHNFDRARPGDGQSFGTRRRRKRLYDQTVCDRRTACENPSKPQKDVGGG